MTDGRAQIEDLNRNYPARDLPVLLQAAREATAVVGDESSSTTR